jgi:hypothetical protein
MLVTVISGRWNNLRVAASATCKMRWYLQDASHLFLREVIAFGFYLPSLKMMLPTELYSANVEERQCCLSISINLTLTISWCLFAAIQSNGMANRSSDSPAPKAASKTHP